jgi:hypothetical protein
VDRFDRRILAVVPRNPKNSQVEWDEPAIVRRYIFYVFAATFSVYQIALVTALAIVLLWPRPANAALTKIVLSHFVSIVGLPTAALMAFAVVWAFRATEGAIEGEAIGFKFKGASGPVLLWVVVFVAIVCAVKATW